MLYNFYFIPPFHDQSIIYYSRQHAKIFCILSPYYSRIIPLEINYLSLDKKLILFRIIMNFSTIAFAEHF
jgi:hypothetical protein